MSGFCPPLFNLVFYGINMKKINNKYRSNNSNTNTSTIYSLNYKFDSNSIAGKVNGTALELIKRYNDFAKDAQSNNDYVSAEIFRQYAEHYRKIVTEINERKNQLRQTVVETNDNRSISENEISAQKKAENGSATVCENTTGSVAEVQVAETTALPAEEKQKSVEMPVVKRTRKSFKIIEISPAKADEVVTDIPAQAPEETAPKRVCRRRRAAALS